MEIEEFFKTHGVDYREVGEHHHCTTGFINTDCPDCSPRSGKFRLGWNLRYNYFNCWLCGKLPTKKTLAELSGLSYAEIARLVKQIEPDETQEVVAKRGRLVYPGGMGPLFNPHKKYLRKRGFVPEEIENIWHIKGIGHLSPFHAWSIWIPIEADGDIVSWTTRSIGETAYRYKTAEPHQEKVSHKTVLYGEDHCKHSCIIVEGPTDAWRIGRGAVATFGLEYTRAQVLAMSRFPKKYVCFDNSKIAQKVAQKLCAELSVLDKKGYQTQNIELDAEDPGSASDREIRRLRRLLK